MIAPFSRLAVAATVACTVAVTGFAAQSGSGGTAAGQKQSAAAAPPGQEAAPKKSKLAKLAEPWPSAEKLRQRRIDAETRAMFSGTDPVAFTLRADFKTVNRDRNPDSTKRHPATLVIDGPGGQPREIAVELSTRGRARLNIRTCSVVPLKIDFPDKKQVAGTAFDGQEELKLVTHCQNSKDYEQYVLREYLAYRVINLLTPRSYRARLAKGTYVDTASSDRDTQPRWAMFIEDDGDVAKRMDGRIAALENRLFRQLDQDTLTRMMLLQYFVGNTDLSIAKLHNVRLVQDVKGAYHPISYDFDYAGLVDTHYAQVSPILKLGSVRERLYRGPCHSMEVFAPFFEEFRAKKTELLALYDSMPELQSDYSRNAKRYIEEFYRTIDSPGAAKRTFVDKCDKIAGI